MEWIDIAHTMGQHNFDDVSISTSSTTSVMNLSNGCLMRETTVTAQGSVTTSPIHLSGVRYENGVLRALTMKEMLGDEMGEMAEKMSGLTGMLGKFGK